MTAVVPPTMCSLYGRAVLCSGQGLNAQRNPSLPNPRAFRPIRAVSGDIEDISQDDPTEAQKIVHGNQSVGVTRSRRRYNRGKWQEQEYENAPQHFGGALTTLLFGAVLLSERLNGIGIVQALELQNQGFHPLLLASILALMVAAAWPEERERKNPSVLVRIQMAAARVAYLGLAGAIAAEMFTGKGILALVDIETGVEAVSDIEAVIAFIVFVFLTGPQSRVVK